MRTARKRIEQVSGKFFERSLIYKSNRQKIRSHADDDNHWFYYRFSNADYIRFKKHLIEIYMRVTSNEGTPDFPWIKCNGMPRYTITQHNQENGRRFITIKFSRVVRIQDVRFGKVFRIGGPTNHSTPIF